MAHDLAQFRAVTIYSTESADGCIGCWMSTLDEIEAAARQLPLEQQQLLLVHLSARLKNAMKGNAHFIEERLSEFPVSKGRVPITSEDVARIEAGFELK